MIHHHILPLSGSGTAIGHWGVSNAADNKAVLFQLDHYASYKGQRLKMSLVEAAEWLAMLARGIEGEDTRLAKGALIPLPEAAGWRIMLLCNEDDAAVPVGSGVYLDVPHDELVEMMRVFSRHLQIAVQAYCDNQMLAPLHAQEAL